MTEQRTAGVGTGLAGKGMATVASRHLCVLSEQNFVLSQEQRDPDVSEHVNITASGIFLCFDLELQKHEG